MVKPIDIYNGTFGLNTITDPVRISAGSDKAPGMIELAVAVDVSIDDTGMVSLRKGDLLAESGTFHSLFCSGGDAFVIQDRTDDAALMKIATDLSISGIRSGLIKGKRMSFTQVNTDTYYSNGLQNGYVHEGLSAAWPVNTYHGPDTNSQFVPTPVGNHIAFKAGGLMLIAEGPTLWICHEPFAFGLFNKRSGFVQFGSDITMICPVAAGVFVSDCEKTWFLRGTSWFDFIQVKVADYPALEWSLAHDAIDLKVAISDKLNGFGRVWATPEGVCLGMDDGNMINLTQEKIAYPSGYTTGACLITDSHILHTV